MLHKTIVFITHDFDEALRLADRIAIMKDGAIDQLGTAEEIVTDPATDYVREFTKEVSREKLLRVASVMLPGEAAEGAESVAGGERLATVAGRILRSDRPIRVVDDAGQALGVVTRERVIEALYDRPG
jgi:glycine betaine/proline transport system ATP-binding protein